MGIEIAPRADRELDFHPAMKMRWEVTQTTAESSGALFECACWFDAHMPGPPPHMHPNVEESFEVLEGSIEVFKDGAWTKLGPGETLRVPAGTPHSLRNSSDEPAKVIGRFEPAGRSEEFFRRMQALVRDSKVKSSTDLRSGIYLAMVFDQYPDVSRLTGLVGPAMKTLALTGKVLRFKLSS